MYQKLTINAWKFSPLSYKKFVRVDGQLLHLHSVAGLTHTNFNIPMHYSYDELLRLTRYLTGSQQAVKEQFKRMILT